MSRTLHLERLNHPRIQLKKIDPSDENGGTERRCPLYNRSHNQWKTEENDMGYKYLALGLLLSAFLIVGSAFAQCGGCPAAKSKDCGMSTQKADNMKQKVIKTDEEWQGAAI